jgi:hypothetical protein
MERGGVEGCTGIIIFCRVPECLSELGPPPPSSVSECGLPPGHSHAGEGVGVPNSDEGTGIFYSAVYSNPFTGVSTNHLFNLGVKKVVAPSKNSSKLPIMCFAPHKKITSRILKISGTLIVSYFLSYSLFFTRIFSVRKKI